MRVPAALLVAFLVCALLVAPAGGAVATPADRSTGVDGAVTDDVTLLQQTDDGDESVRQTLRIQMTGEGHAEWTVTTTYELNDENDRQAFEQLVEDLQNGETDDVGYSAETFRTFADDAAENTGREMTVRDETWDGTVDDDTGTLALTFTWTNFAAVDGDRTEVADVFGTTDGGTWLPSLNAEQRLVIVAPDGYAVDGFSLDTPPDSGFENRTAQWTGPVTFEADDIRITYVGTGGSPGQPSPPGEDGFSTTALVGGLGLFAVVALAALLLLSARSNDLAPVERVATHLDLGAESEDTSVDAGRPGTGRDESDTVGAVTEAQSGPSEEHDAHQSDGKSDEAAVDPELLSDEERVVRLIEENGGRMKQANIVSETGWSNAKVSQLLSAMAEDGRIDKLRIGRENLISLPDEDVTETEP